MASIFIREVPAHLQKKTNKILGEKIANNGKRYTKNDIYIMIFERGILELSKPK